MTRVYRVAVCAAIAMLQVTLAFGQLTTATVRGLVEDGQGRPVPSATVTVTTAATGLARAVPVAEDGTYTVAGWGLSGDTLVPADYDGDGKAEIAVFRPSTGHWYIRDRFNRSWGLAGDAAAVKSP